MSAEWPCRIYTTAGLEVDLETIDMVKYYPREPGLRGQGDGADIPIAYAYVRGSCVAVRGEESIQHLRRAWRAWKLNEGRGER